MINNPDPLPIAVRVFPDLSRDIRSPKRWRRPDSMFVFDTETTIDATQRLMFGNYRRIVAGRCVEEGLFYADDLPEQDRRVLEAYVSTHHADTANRAKRPLHLITRAEFLKKLYRASYKSRCLLVGFNLPFDLSRVAFDS